MRTSEDRGIPSFLKEPLRELVEGLRSLDPEADVYLCGSYARGDWLKDSDLDLVVVSRIFAGSDTGARFSMVKRLIRPGLSLDVLAYTPREFEEARGRSVVLEDMMEYGLKITSNEIRP